MEKQEDHAREYLEDLRNEQMYAQAEHNRGSTTPMPKDGRIAKYLSFYDYSGGETSCDKVYVDRTTGKVALRYDAADPANTNPSYGARPDKDYLPDIGALIHPSKQTVSDADIKAQFVLDPPYHPDDEYDDWDDDWDDEAEVRFWEDQDHEES